jgi:hypothetical protein
VEVDTAVVEAIVRSAEDLNLALDLVAGPIDAARVCGGRCATTTRLGFRAMHILWRSLDNLSPFSRAPKNQGWLPDIPARIASSADREWPVDCEILQVET